MSTNLKQNVPATPTTSGAPIRGGSFLIEERRPEDIFTPEDFTEQHRLILQTADRFMREEVLPRWQQIEHQEPGLTEKLLRQAGELGLLSIDIPEAYGGMELDIASSMIATEQMSQYASFAVSYGAHTGIGTLPIVYFGTEEQKRKYLPRLATGELIAAYCLSEAEAGSDALAARTRATISADGKHYLLNGEKMWITNGGYADLFIIFAKIDGEKFSAIIVEKNFPGVSTGAEEKKMGIKGSSTRALILDNVPVPVENLLGQAGRGHVIAFNILNVGRLRLAAGCVGGSKQALEDAATYAKQRRAFGKAIAEFGLIQEKLAEMAARTFAGESIVYRTAGLIDALLAAGARAEEVKAIEEYAIECSINKVYCSEILDYVADECVQIYGGYGYHQDYPAERAYRDARINRIFEGTNEINRMVTVNMLLKRGSSGQLALMPGAMQLMQEALSPATETASGAAGLLGTEKQIVTAVKKAALWVAALAYQKYLNDLANQQEIVAAVSDIVMEAFAMESVVLRAQKIASRAADPEKAGLAANMARLWVHTRLELVEQRARTALAATAGGDSLRTHLAFLNRLVRRNIVNVIGLRREIAAVVVRHGKYPL
ncbi:MAG: acyl-CoA dehydrogenase family protein [Acidobacteria bacterium]|nr:acyl-CoA dehydrogenase family protein [Acidobacteriota bacterium]